MTEEEIFVLLAKRYENRRLSTSHLLLRHVPDGVGGDFSRRSDAVLFELYPSRGYTISGFEIKVNRNDWLSELKRPDKADAVGRHCDYWWLVVADDSIVKPNELPKPWGLMVASKSGQQLRAKVKPTALPCDPVDRIFLAGVCRAVTNQKDDQQTLTGMIVNAEHKGYRRGFAKGKSAANDSYDNQRNRRLQESIKQFEEKSGVRIDEWNGEKVGMIVNAALHNNGVSFDLNGAISRLTDLSDSSKNRADELRAAQVELEALKLPEASAT